MKTVVGIFNDVRNAEKAARQVKDEGLRTSDISIVAKDTDTASKTGTGNARNDGTWIMGTNNNALSGTASSDTTAANTTATNATGTDTHKTGTDNISGGVVTGGVLGGLAGLLIGAGSLMVPGLGIIAAAGPLAGLISGTVTGGVVGGLIDLGIPEKQSRKYESDIKSGKILFSMKADNQNINRISDILRGNHADSVDTY